MSANSKGTTNAPSSVLEARAKALAMILQEEFETSFQLFDAATGQALHVAGHEEGAVNFPTGPHSVQQTIQAGRSRVEAQENVYQISMILYEGNRPRLVAYGQLPCLAAESGRGAELRRLQKWVDAVSNRLCMTEQLALARRDHDEQAAQLKRAWELLLNVGAVVRNTRPYKEPHKNRNTILKSVRSLLHVQAMIWVPDDLQEPTLSEGDLRLTTEECRYLAAQIAQKADRESSRPEIWNTEMVRPLAQRLPAVGNLLAFPINEHQAGGWLIAVNKRQLVDARTPKAAADMPLVDFRRADAAALSPFAAIYEMLLRTSRRFQDLRELLVGLTRALTSALDAKDAYTYGHSERVARIAIELGVELGLTEDELSDIYLAGLLHDIGKIGVPDAVLTKQGALTDDEFNIIKQHVTIGHRILAELKPLSNLLPGVLHHHERIDGKGYPAGLAGESIPMLARVLAVADAYDAMSTERSYRHAMQISQIENTLRQGAGTQWDQNVVDAFFRCHDRVHRIRQRGVGQSLNQAIDGALRSGDSAYLHQTNWVSL